MARPDSDFYFYELRFPLWLVIVPFNNYMCSNYLFTAQPRTVRMEEDHDKPSFVDCLHNPDKYPEVLLQPYFEPLHFTIRQLCHASKAALPAGNTKSVAGDYMSSVTLVVWAMQCHLRPHMAFRAALKGCQCEMVTFFTTQYKWPEGYWVTPGTCWAAALCGNLDGLKHLHWANCSWDEVTCMVAALRGHFECLKFACENGCPMDVKMTCHWAAIGKHTECHKYVIARKG
jgi:hypothetical protein